MKLSICIAVLCVAGASARKLTIGGPGVAMVHDYINDEPCKAVSGRFHKPACIDGKTCYPYGTEAKNNCKNIDKWQWVDLKNPDAPNNYAPGVNPPAHQRITHNGDDAQKLVWAYTGSIRQAEAYEVYSKEEGGQVNVDMLLNTAVNHITFIANVNVEEPAHWFVPGANNTAGCGQMQTWELPFGFNGTDKDKALTTFQTNLKTLHEAGVTITLTMGSWCTQLPINQEDEWTPDQFEEFVDYFRVIQETVFGGSLDGIDFDWEGFCTEVCLKGHNTCTCDWSDEHCGELSPEELAKGVYYTEGGRRKQCWILPTKSTMQIMTGITKHMKDAGFAVTLVPMSTSLYTGEDDKTEKQVMRNEYGKYRMQPYDGGKPITTDGKQYNLLDMCDAILLQWYSGFDASLCRHTDDPTACTCDNKPADDYPNWVNVSQANGLLIQYYDTPAGAGNMFPSMLPVRCEACGANVTLPNGTKANIPCGPKDEEWFTPRTHEVNGTVVEDPSVIAEHNKGIKNYSDAHDGGMPYWRIPDFGVASKCPRGIDCPDWRYEGEDDYFRQVKLLEKLSKIVDLKKVAIGFETLGIDVLIQTVAWEDKALPWSNVTNTEKWTDEVYYHQCAKNLTKEDIKGGALTNTGPLARCAQPLLTAQWGLKFDADDVVGLEAAVQSKLGAQLAGIGIFTLDGVLAMDPNAPNAKQHKPHRFWYPTLNKLNQTYKIPSACGSNCWPVPEM